MQPYFFPYLGHFALIAAALSRGECADVRGASRRRPHMVDEGEFGNLCGLLIKLLKAENAVARRYFYPAAHGGVPCGQEFPQFVESLPSTDAACASAIQFPIGALVTSSGIEKVCRLLPRIQMQSRNIRAALES